MDLDFELQEVLDRLDAPKPDPFEVSEAINEDSLYLENNKSSQAIQEMLDRRNKEGLLGPNEIERWLLKFQSLDSEVQVEKCAHCIEELPCGCKQMNLEYRVNSIRDSLSSPLVLINSLND